MNAPVRHFAREACEAVELRLRLDELDRRAGFLESEAAELERVNLARHNIRLRLALLIGEVVQ